jgi:hypothetical protein
MDMREIILDFWYMVSLLQDVALYRFSTGIGLLASSYRSVSIYGILSLYNENIDYICSDTMIKL